MQAVHKDASLKGFKRVSKEIDSPDPMVTN